jgi:hypothetical protein
MRLAPLLLLLPQPSSTARRVVPNGGTVSRPSLEEIVRPGASNAFARRAPALVQLDGSTGAEWSRGLKLPAYTLQTRPLADRALHRHMPASDAARAPLLPSLFMPGFPKSATSWLYECMMSTFTPGVLGCGPDPDRWDAAHCPKRFLLTALSSNPKGEIREQKETFYFGGTQANFYNRDLVDLHGPDPRRGALENASALWLWAKTQWRMSRARKAYQRAAQAKCGRGQKSCRHVEQDEHRERMARLRTVCDAPAPSQACALTRANATAARAVHARCARKRGGKSSGELPARCGKAGLGRLPLKKGIPGVGPNRCFHPGCDHIAFSVPKSWSGPCMWQRELDQQLGAADIYCLRSVTPWAAAAEVNVSLVDFTPNYMCDPDALRRVREATSEPSRLRFIVVMRDPIMRAFSEWSMFALGWEWEPVTNFSEAVAPKLGLLRECNETLFQNVTALRSLPTDELLKYMRRCFARGKAMAYPQTSMYAVCVENALRYFKREQFLFLRYEDLMRMDARAILRLVARHTGLHLDERVLKAAEREGKCQPHSKLRGRPMSYSSHSRFAAEFLEEAAPPLERFFSPYNEWLAELIHPDFRWHRSDHVKRRLNATEKAAQKVWEDEVKAIKAERHRKKKQNILKLGRESVAWVNSTNATAGPK